MAMPSQYSQLLPILLLLLFAATAHTILAADAVTLEGCPEKCGNISIPFPFGIKPGCFRDGFEVICDYSFSPPRAFLTENSAYHPIGDMNYSSYSSHDNKPKPNSSVYTLVETQLYEPVELVDISASKSELRLYDGVASDCINPGTVYDHREKQHTTQFSQPFLVSLLRNVLVGVGENALAQVYRAKFIVTECRMSFPMVLFDRNPETRSINGSCTGQGCCQVSFPSEVSISQPLTTLSVMVSHEESLYPTALCSYGMVVESLWYNFSSEDMFGDLVLSKKHPRGVPFMLDFAIRDRSCPAQDQQPPEDYACSHNSHCAKPPSGDGYVCRCWDNYDGNPYITNGCQDINECEHGHLNNCSSGSICKNTLGGYECPCKSGMRGDGKGGTCTEIFPLPAKMAVGYLQSDNLDPYVVVTHSCGL